MSDHGAWRVYRCESRHRIASVVIGARQAKPVGHRAPVSLYVGIYGFNSKKQGKWTDDAAFAVHPDMKSHSGMSMTMGKGSITSLSRKQKLNTRSSTEAELVAVDDCMAQVLWTKFFLQAQGYDTKANIVLQDNTSAIKLEKNGQKSMGQRPRHINIRYVR